MASDTYPTKEQIEKADDYTIRYWFRFLRYPTNDNEKEIMRLISQKWRPPTLVKSTLSFRELAGKDAK